MDALVLDDVTKRFGERTAVDALSFTVKPGEIFGFLGGNGAGKTTSLRMVLDILRPTSGRIAVLGCPPGRENAAELGFMPEERGLYRGMSAIDTVTYFGRLKGMTTAAARAKGHDLLERFGLAGSAKMHIDKLSKGMAQKVQLAATLVNSPKLLLLDEPFSGLDPVNQGLLEDEILDAARGGATVIFSTHVMQHAERLCDRLLLLSQGRKVFEGTQPEARGRLPARLGIVSRDTPMRCPGVDRAEEVATDSDGWRTYDVTLGDGIDPADVLQCLTEQGITLRRFDQHRVSLHEVFLHLVGTNSADTQGQPS
jgi:ABC-2 type transport system ATP-binding protein